MKEAADAASFLSLFSDESDILYPLDRYNLGMIFLEFPEASSRTG